MRTLPRQGALSAALLASTSAACTEDIGAASQALAATYCIHGAYVDARTVHFQGPDWLLGSTEGAGPQQLDLRIDHYVQPAVRTTGSFKLDASAVSSAVGFSMAERYELLAGAQADVASLRFQRLEAYTAYRPTIWEVCDASCGAVLGRGTSTGTGASPAAEASSRTAARARHHDAEPAATPWATLRTMPTQSLALRSIALVTLTLGGLLGATACSNSPGSGGPVTGPADMHCGGMVQPIDQAVCKMPVDADAGPGGPQYGATLDNAEGDDDDCKYHVSWTSTGIGENQDVTFTVVATTKTDGKPLTGADPSAEVFLSPTHPAPNTKQKKAAESPPGTYAIGPVRFDAPGKWTVRYHFYETCTDASSASPHGHAAFYVDVP